ncbi:GGDEF domain-containing protein [Psychromonas sp. MME1]|uniref:GGDEF domain-containing protein n=1 Tax=Psychromonas sp. MME1 TaxID=3231032 RepID=UPI0034E2F850
MNERLSIEYNRYTRYNNDLSIAIIDVDKFKKINDTFGHVAGDKVISVVALMLQKSLRNTDFIARYGGDEFVLLLPETNQQQAQNLLDKLCEKIRSIPFKFKKENISITISIGCTSFTKRDSIETAFERADKALFHAKDNGRDRYITFKEEA